MSCQVIIKPLTHFLFNKKQELNDLNKYTRKMQNEYQKYFPKRTSRLLTSSLKQFKSLSKFQGTPNLQQKDFDDSEIAKHLLMGKQIAERYESEIATISKMKEYTDISLTQKEKLFQQNRQMRHKFSEEVLEAKKLENTVSTISSMISEFLEILQSQSETVQDMHKAGKDATAHVEQVDEELVLTIQRTQSHSTMMISVIVFFSILLIFLDYLTP